VQPSKTKLNTESADTKKQLLNKILHKSFLKVQMQAEENGFGTSNFKGLRNISMDYENSAYKYMYGETPDYDESKNLLEEAKAKGYKSAFGCF
jgi:N-acetylmuramoyl-L-alanine amidase